MPAKKKGKPKGKTVALNEFLNVKDGPLPTPSSSSWATEMENVDDDEDHRQPSFDRSKLPTAPKAARGPDVDLDRIPDKPPYTAFVGNLAYDVSEEKISDFFENHSLQVVNVRLPNENGRQRGFGYVEFATKEDLINALTLSEESFSGRKLRVDLAESGGGDRQDRDGIGRSDRDDWRGGGDPNRTESDWRRRDPPSFDDRGGGGGFGDRRGFGDRDRYGDRDRGGFSDRGFNDRGGGRYGDRDGGRDSDRYGDRNGDRGYFSDRSGGGFSDRGGGRYGDRDGGYGRRDGYGDRRGGGFDDRRGGYDDRRDGYNDRGYGGRRDGGYRRDDDGGRPSYRDDRGDRGGSRDGSQEGPKERPRLNLQPRTKPVEQATPQEAGRSSSIFGSAKPVDTAAKEREIEEKMKKLDTTAHFTSEESSYRDAREGNRDSREGGRTRRDSDRSDGGRGPPRERRLSNSSKTSGGTRRDSETSRTSDDSQPPAREERKMVPAPPPKENAWGRPRQDRPPEPARQMSSGSQDENSQNSSSRRDYGHQGDSGRGYNSGRQDGRRYERRDDPPSQRRPAKEKALPKSIEDMPKLYEGPGRDWADANKFAAIMDDDDFGSDGD